MLGYLGRNRNKYIAKKRVSDLQKKKWWQRINWATWISSLATLVTAIFIFIQIRISNHQSKILEAQTKIFEKQTELINFQNNRISQQTNLQEAERRSSIVYLFSNVLDKIDEELKTKELAGAKRTLSTELIARIASLTQALKPYKYLNNDTIISRAVSPEKGQLLSALINFNLEENTYDSIFSKSNFRGLELENAFLKGASFKNLDLSHSVFYNCNLSDSNFKNTNLINVIFTRSNISDATFQDCDLRSSEIKGVTAVKSKFINCDYNKTDYSYSNLRGSHFSSGHNLVLEFGTLVDKTDLDLDNSINLKKLKDFNEFKLSESLSGVHQHPEINIMFYHKISDRIDINNMSMPFEFNKAYMDEVLFDNANLTNVELENYIIRNSSFDSTVITQIKFKNITLIDTYYENSMLDSETFKNYFQEEYQFKNEKYTTRLKLLTSVYDTIKAEFNDSLQINMGRGWKQEGQSKKITRPYSYYLKKE